VFVNGRVALVEGHPTTASAGLVLNRRAP
jgi:hypothetical protein